jgi:RNA polymerase sigma factor for flagellar operon FliA
MLPPPEPSRDDEALREERALDLFRGELDLVDLNARQVARRIGSCAITLDDLRSFGQEGLLRAARSFDASRGVPFRRWANLRIRGAMIDGVRQWGALPRRVFQELRAIAAADRLQGAYYEEETAHATTSAEAADSRLTTYLAGLATAMSLGGAGTAVREPADDDATPEERAIQANLIGLIKQIVSGLPDPERTLVERHYFGEETLDHAARSLGLSKSWGSRLHARAIDAIARELKKGGVAP